MVKAEQLIAAVSPDIFCDPEVRKNVKQIAKEKGYLAAAEKAKLIESMELYNWDRATKDPMGKWGLKSPVERHEIEYDSPSEGLEPIYFWILDFLTKTGADTKKLVDNFSSSVGSGHFSELQGKATRMQEEAMKMLGSANTVLRSILNIVYDLKEFKIRLQTYDELNSKDPKIRNAAFLALKQIWMDRVDMHQRGPGSINALASGALDFVTLRDAFMAASSLSAIDELDLNERVKRILKQRFGEFEKWIKESESSLRQRYEIERKYLKSQYNSLKLYSRWIKPYLEAAKALEQSENDSAALVSAFNTILLNLTIMAKYKYDPSDDVDSGLLPETFKKIKLRKYFPIVIVEFSFRGIPQKSGQHYVFGGKANIKFTSYALNEDELDVFSKAWEESTVMDVMKYIQGATEESLAEIADDVKKFIEEDKKEDENKKKVSEDINPFTALFSFLKPNEKKEKEKNKAKSNSIRPDSEYEKIVRSQAILDARGKCWTVFDIYKRAHRMPAHQDPFDVTA